MIQPGDTLLFQGDSITDCGRARNIKEPNNPNALGCGYAGHAAAALMRRHPGRPLTCFNRAVSGDRVRDLLGRWQPDCLDLQPTVLSLLIGVNDMWRTKDQADTSPPQVYEDHLRQLLQQTKEALPDIRLIVGEPFVTRTGAVTDDWFPEFDQRRAIACKLADEFDAAWVPFQNTFDSALTNEADDPAVWAHDGIHPTPAGHQLMAEAWLAAADPDA